MDIGFERLRDERDESFSKRRSAFDVPKNDDRVGQRDGEVVESLRVRVRQGYGEDAQILILDEVGEQLGKSDESGEELEDRNRHRGRRRDLREAQQDGRKLTKGGVRHLQGRHGQGGDALTSYSRNEAKLETAEHVAAPTGVQIALVRAQRNQGREYLEYTEGKKRGGQQHKLKR